MYLLAPTIVQNLQKIVRVDPKLLGRFIFALISSHLAQMRLFLKKNISITFMHLLVAFLKQKFKSYYTKLLY